MGDFIKQVVKQYVEKQITQKQSPTQVATILISKVFAIFAIIFTLIYPNGPNIEKLVCWLLKHANECMRISDAVVSTIPCTLLLLYRIALGIIETVFFLFFLAIFFLLLLSYGYQLIGNASQWSWSLSVCCVLWAASVFVSWAHPLNFQLCFAQMQVFLKAGD